MTSRDKVQCSACDAEFAQKRDWEGKVLSEQVCPNGHTNIAYSGVNLAGPAPEDDELWIILRKHYDREWLPPFAGLEPELPSELDWPYPWWLHNDSNIADRFARTLMKLTHDGTLIPLASDFYPKGFVGSNESASERFLSIAQFLDRHIAELEPLAHKFEVTVPDILRTVGYTWWATPARWRELIRIKRSKAYGDYSEEQDDVLLLQRADQIVDLESRLFGEKSWYKDKDTLAKDIRDQFDDDRPIPNALYKKAIRKVNDLRTGLLIAIAMIFILAYHVPAIRAWIAELLKSKLLL